MGNSGDLLQLNSNARTQFYEQLNSPSICHQREFTDQVQPCAFAP